MAIIQTDFNYCTSDQNFTCCALKYQKMEFLSTLNCNCSQEKSSVTTIDRVPLMGQIQINISAFLDRNLMRLNIVMKSKIKPEFLSGQTVNRKSSFT